MPNSKGEHFKISGKDKYQKRMSNDNKENPHSHVPLLFPRLASTHGRHRSYKGGYAGVVCAALDANRAELGANYASHSARAQSTFKSPVSFTHIPVLDMIERHAPESPSNISNGACCCDIIYSLTRNSNRLPKSSSGTGSTAEINAKINAKIFESPDHTSSGSDNAAPGMPQASGHGSASDMATVKNGEEELIPMLWDVPQDVKVAPYFSRMPFDSWSHHTYARFMESRNSTAQRDYDEFDRGLQILASDDRVPAQIQVLASDLRERTTFAMFRTFVQDWRAESAQRGGRLL